MSRPTAEPANPIRIRDKTIYRARFLAALDDKHVMDVFDELIGKEYEWRIQAIFDNPDLLVRPERADDA